MTLSIMILSKMTLNIMTFNAYAQCGLFWVLLFAEYYYVILLCFIILRVIISLCCVSLCHYSECYSGECHYTECGISFCTGLHERRPGHPDLGLDRRRVLHRRHDRRIVRWTHRFRRRQVKRADFFLNLHFITFLLSPRHTACVNDAILQTQGSVKK